MEIICNQTPYILTAQELRKASEEWEHLCLMHRIVAYLADYYNLPLSLHLTTKEQQINLSRFYNLYHLPFEALVKVHEDPVEALTDCPDPVYLFLSSLAQTYESDIHSSSISEEEAFQALFSDKEIQALDRGNPRTVRSARSLRSDKRRYSYLRSFYRKGRSESRKAGTRRIGCMADGRADY